MPRFEVRDAGNPADVSEFRCDLVRRIIDNTINGESAHQHEDLIPSQDGLFRDKPNQFEFALAVIATIVQRPDAACSPRAPSPEEKDNQPPTPEPGSMSRVISEMMRRIMDHWAGPAVLGWSTRKRFWIASGGSLTFFLFWSALMTTEADINIMPTMDDLPAVGQLLLIVLVVLTLTPFYGYLVSLVDRQHGPVRLYLGGFLLPYFVWFLLSQMTNSSVPAPDGDLFQ